MLFKFSFVPDVDKTHEAMINRNPGADELDIQESVADIFKNVYSPSYDLFVKADHVTNAHRRLNKWFDEPTCFLNHQNFEQIVFTLIAECVSVSDVDTILNAVDILD